MISIRFLQIRTLEIGFPNNVELIKKTNQFEFLTRQNSIHILEKDAAIYLR